MKRACKKRFLVYVGEPSKQNRSDLTPRPVSILKAIKMAQAESFGNDRCVLAVDVTELMRKGKQHLARMVTFKDGVRKAH